LVPAPGLVGRVALADWALAVATPILHEYLSGPTFALPPQALSA